MKKILWLILCLTGNINAQTIDSTLWSVNEGAQVNDLIKDGNILYIGGNFSKIAMNTGCVASFSQSDAKLNVRLPIVSPGNIYTTIPDGNGGWYIGGSFQIIRDTVYNNLVHVFSDGRVDQNFNPSPNGTVKVIVIRNNKLYIAGSFFRVSDKSRFRLAEIDLGTGKLTDWNFGVSHDVNAMVLSGNKLFVGGAFSTVGIKARTRVACIDLNTGKVTDWNPQITGGTVNALAVHEGQLYIGGSFTKIAGETRNRLAVLDTSTGNPLNWNPGADNTVSVITISGSLLYAGGEFTHIGGVERKHLAAIDLVSAGTTSWSPDPDNQVNTIVVAENSIYVGGNFTRIGGKPQSYLARLNEQGILSNWNAFLNAPVTSLYVYGRSVLAGGMFSAANETERNKLAAIDLSTGTPTAWNPNLNGTVNKLTLYGNTVIVGGNFTKIDTVAVSKLAMIDKSTGKAINWTPNPNNDVNAMLVHGNLLFVGGAFTKIGEQQRARLAAVNLETGQLSAFNPNVSNVVNTMLLSGDNLFVGGLFTAVGGQTRFRLASINVNTGLPNSWNPSANNAVYSMVLSGSVIYVGGAFTNVTGIDRNYLAAIDTSSNKPRQWNVVTDNIVRSIALSGSTIYFAGDFMQVNNFERNRIAAADTVGSGQLLNWSVNLSNSVNALQLNNDCGREIIYLGGAFNSVNGFQQKGITALSGLNQQTTVSISKVNVNCPGQTNGQISILAEGEYGPYSYSVNGNDFVSSSVYSGLAAGYYTFYVRDAEGCIFKIFSSISEPAALTLNETIVNEQCHGQRDGAIYLSPDGGTAPYTISWSNGSSNQQITGLGQGAYTVRMSDQNGCMLQDTILVETTLLPKADFGYSIQNNQVVFTNLSKGGAADTYEWNFGDAQTSDEENPEHTYLYSATYKACLTVRNSCGTDSVCRIFNYATGMNQSAFSAAGFILQPNPAKDFIQVSTTGTSEPMRWSVLDLSGKEIIPEQITSGNKFTIDLSSISSGYYLLRLTQNSQTSIQRFIHEANR